MTITEAHDLMDFYIDKVAAPYLSRREKDRLLNQAQIQYLAQQFVASSEAPFEVTRMEGEHINFLIPQPVFVNADSNGLVKYADILAQLPAVDTYREGIKRSTPVKPSDIFGYLTIRAKVGSAAAPSTNPKLKVNYGGTDPQAGVPKTSEFALSTFVRHSDRWKFEQNELKRGVEPHSNHTYYDRGLRFLPSGVRVCEFTVVRYPMPVSYDLNALSDVNDTTSTPGSAAVDPEWSNKIMPTIIGIALQLAGVSIREQELIQGAEVVKND